MSGSGTRIAEGSASEPTPLQVALRHKWTILAIAALAAGGVYAWLGFVTPTYVAEADVRIDMPQLRGMTDDNTSLLRAEQPSLELVKTEMAVLNSPRLAVAAVKALGLQTLPAFQDCPPPSRLQRLRDLLGRVRGEPAAMPACATSFEYAAKVLLNSLSFTSDRASYIIQIGAAAADAELAARIANGYAEAYIAWQGNLKASLALQADQWLSTDLANMQAKMLADDAAVEAYRQRHHLIGLHAKLGESEAVDTVWTQRLEQRNADLGTVAALLTEKSSILAQVRQALAAGQFEAIPPILNAPLIQALLTRQAELSSNLAELRANYGPTYPSAAAAVAALARNEAQIRAEADKIVRSLAGEVAELAARKAAMATQVAGIETQVADESRAAVDLSELQRTAETDRRIYESLFVRLKQIDAERRMEQANAAVVVEAVPPDFPAYPRKQMIVAGTFLAALGAGIGLAFGIETMSRRFRDTEQVEGEVGLPVLGIFARRRRAPQDMSVDRPMSVEAEALQGVLTQLVGGLDRRADAPLGRVVMVTSALPGEGKSCLSVALGRSAMRAGLSAFVLDCDLRRPTVAKLLSASRRDAVFPDAADPIADIVRAAGVDERSALRHLALGSYVANPHGLMAWPGLARTLAYLRTRYDLVVIDTPPVLAVSDALKLGGLADDVVLAIDWNDTPRAAVLAAVRALQRAQIAVTGLVMTKVDLRRYARANGGEGFYLRHYRGYRRALDIPA